MATQPTKTAETSWTITGASVETRDKVKKAAAAEGMTIRAWVDRTLNAAADGRLGKGSGGLSAADAKTLPDMSAKVLASAAVLKAVAAGLGEMQRSAKDQARAAEGKPAKKKTKPKKAPQAKAAGGA